MTGTSALGNPRPKRILIRGNGIAVSGCAFLLKQHHRAVFDLRVESAARSPVPAVMLSDASIALLRGVFARTDLFRASSRIRKRVVAWGSRAVPVAFDHAAVVLSEADLIDALAANVLNVDSVTFAPEFTLFGSRPLPPEVVEHHFGLRCATMIQVELDSQAAPEACWIEAHESGWLFLITTSPGAGSLLIVGERPDDVIAQSRLIGKQIARIGPEIGSFPAWPRIAAPLAGTDWLACGSVAIGFDPICGDGTANAVREAVLAAAVVSAIQQGGDPSSLLSHYDTRLTAAFRKHLELCLGYYVSADRSAWWETEANAIRRGIDWCNAKLASAPAAQYRLHDLELIPVRCHT